MYEALTYIFTHFDLHTAAASPLSPTLVVDATDTTEAMQEQEDAPNALMLAIVPTAATAGHCDIAGLAEQRMTTAGQQLKRLEECSKLTFGSIKNDIGNREQFVGELRSLYHEIGTLRRSALHNLEEKKKALALMPTL